MFEVKKNYKLNEVRIIRIVCRYIGCNNNISEIYSVQRVIKLL